MSDHFSISQEFYDAHEMKFFGIMNSRKKFSSKYDADTIEFLDYIFEKVRNGTQSSQSNIAKFMKLDVIKCLWSTSGSQKFPAFA